MRFSTFSAEIFSPPRLMRSLSRPSMTRLPEECARTMSPVRYQPSGRPDHGGVRQRPPASGRSASSVNCCSSYCFAGAVLRAGAGAFRGDRRQARAAAAGWRYSVVAGWRPHVYGALDQLSAQGGRRRIRSDCRRTWWPLRPPDRWRSGPWWKRTALPAVARATRGTAAASTSRTRSPIPGTPCPGPGCRLLDRCGLRRRPGS